MHAKGNSWGAPDFKYVAIMGGGENQTYVLIE